VLAGWVGTFTEWVSFNDAWVERLNEAPAIDYFKNNEALALKGCFAGFTKQDADQKIFRLAEVLSEHRTLEAYCVAVRHRVYRDHFLVATSSLGDRAPRFAEQVKTQPLHLAFHIIIPLILEEHSERGIKGPIDFIFDDGKEPSRATRWCIELYEVIKEWHERLEHPYYALMGKADTATDRDVKPLQAADLLAGQIRGSLLNNGVLSDPVRRVLDDRRCRCVELDEGTLRAVYPSLFGVD
jgi:hypothetical protein